MGPTVLANFLQLSPEGFFFKNFIDVQCNLQNIMETAKKI